jgi:hypothetical protein
LPVPSFPPTASEREDTYSTLQSEVYELLRTNVSLLKKLADLALERVDSGQAVEAFSISSEEDQDVSSHISSILIF